MRSNPPARPSSSAHPHAAAPLVTIGLATRNRAHTLPYALESLLRQSYANLEIVVADNASEDETPAVLDQFRGRDGRIRPLRHNTALTMWENYHSTFTGARGKYFLLAADDDIYDEKFVERLVVALEAHPDAHLAFGSVRQFLSHERHDQTSIAVDYRLSTDNRPIWRRLLQPRDAGYAVQGLHRVSAMTNYAWWDHSISPDWPLLTYMLVVGEVLAVPEAVIYRPRFRPDSGEERAARQSFTTMERFPSLTVSRLSARAAKAAAAARGSRRIVVVDFVLILLSLMWERRQALADTTAWRSRIHRWFGT